MFAFPRAPSVGSPANIYKNKHVCRYRSPELGQLLTTPSIGPFA